MEYTSLAKKEPRVSSSSVDDDSMMVAICSWPKNDNTQIGTVKGKIS
jgi:hypothetical protein